MAHVRGHWAGYDAWAAGGARGWGAEDLLPFFRRSETAPGRDPRVRGDSGPVLVGPVPAGARHPAARALAAALVGLGCPVTDDLSGGHQEGVAWPDLAARPRGGRRVSPADAYLRPVAGRANLAVLAGSLVTGLTFDGGRCTGAEYVGDG